MRRSKNDLLPFGKKYLLAEVNIATTLEICKNNTVTFHFLIQAGRGRAVKGPENENSRFRSQIIWK